MNSKNIDFKNIDYKNLDYDKATIKSLHYKVEQLEKKIAKLSLKQREHKNIKYVPFKK